MHTHFGVRALARAIAYNCPLTYAQLYQSIIQASILLKGRNAVVSCVGRRWDLRLFNAAILMLACPI
jgi:hypothetical protein